MKVFIVGLGLIGASYAQRLTKQNYDVYGYDKAPKTLQKALKQGIIKSGELETITRCDIIVLALYPKDNVTFIKTHVHLFHEKQIITDVSGVKVPMLKEIERVLPDTISYVSHHPMAGKEKPGYDAKDATLFEGKTAIMIKTSKTDNGDLVKLEAFLSVIGFSVFITTSPKHHDKMIAHTSQLPHVLALVLMALSDTDTPAYAANSYRDLTRIASINAPMWRELFESNKTFLSDEIKSMITELSRIETLIDGKHSTELETYMQKVKEKRDAYGND